MFPTSVDKVLREIASLKDRNPHLTSEMNDRIQTLQMELGFLKIFICFLPSRSRKNHYIRATVGKGMLDLYGDRDRALDLSASKLLQKIELCKPKIREDCFHLLDFSSQRKMSSSYELLEFINCTLSNLKNLVDSKAAAILSVRKQARDLIKKLRMFKDLVKVTGERWIFSINIQDYVFKTAYLSMLCWVDQMDEVMAARMKAIIADLLQMVKSYSPEVVGLYIRVLRASKVFPFNNFEIGEVVASFVDFILPIRFMKILRQELIFLIAFVMDPHPPVMKTNAKKWNLVLTKAKAVAGEIPSLICSLTDGDMNKKIAKERDVLLGNFQRKTLKIKAEVSKLHFQIPESSRSHFPSTNALGFIDFLLENLGNMKETLISKVNILPSTRDLILILHKELVSLRPSLMNLRDMHNEFEELKDLWVLITNLAYHADYVIDSCENCDLPIWYNVICLSDVIQGIKFIKKKIKKIMANQIYTNRILNATVYSGSIHLGKTHTSKIDVIVGFKDEEQTLINRLTRGSMQLDIVSIVGMPGQGKTTLAKKLYNSPSVRYHFNKCAWCFVTQVYNVENLLMDILRDIDDGIRNLRNHDLAERVKKCLSGRRYLIVMDDIWDITAWNALKESFPDDNNGSRILFTSRHKFGCNSLHLRPLSEEEGMELLRQKLLLKDGWPLFLYYYEKEILMACNGLPLAIVAVAGLLTRVSSDLEWKKIVQNLTSKLANDGCMDVLELSYKNLPDFLKPCFLYLGALGKTKVFKVHKLVHLWIAEGFVQKSEIKSLEEVAKEYLEDLVSRSLLIVNKRSFSSGEIKECRIHDLMHELCLKKAQEERFIHFPNSSKHIIYDQYRLCIYDESMLDSWSKHAGSTIRSLLLPRCYRDLWPYEPIFASFISARFLRVLDLGSLEFHHCFPEEIVLLICLRYISINCEVEVIPSSVGNLYNLEFLHLVRKKGVKSIIQFPLTFWKMKRLRNVDVGSGAIILLDDYDANVYPQLGNLDSFSSLYLCNVEDAEKILRGFPRVRELKLELSESWGCRRNCAQFLALNSLSRLESLSLQYPRQVAHICAFNFPTALKSLTLSRSFRPWSEISTIGKLPNLEVLKLLNSAIVGKRWDVEDEAFLNLKYLKLFRLSISHWEASTSSFPCLERLVVRGCDSLVELPSIFGEISTLKMIEARWCLQCLKTSAESILSEQLEMGNEELKVLISDVRIKDNFGYSRRYNVQRQARYRSRKLATLRGSRKFSNFNYPSIYDKMLPYRGTLLDNKVSDEIHDVQKPLGSDKKGVKGRSACVENRYVRIPSRTTLILKHNCQPRQVIMSRHSKMELKRDQ